MDRRSELRRSSATVAVRPSWGPGVPGGNGTALHKSDGYEEVTAQYIVTNRLSIDNELQNLSHDVANYVRGRSVRRRADVLHSTFVERWKSVVLDESEIEL